MEWEGCRGPSGGGAGDLQRGKCSRSLVLLLPDTGWFPLNPHITSFRILLCPQTELGAPNHGDSVVCDLFPIFPMDCELPGGSDYVLLPIPFPVPGPIRCLVHIYGMKE